MSIRKHGNIIGGFAEVDSTLDASSRNPISNRAVAEAIENISTMHLDAAPTTSTVGVFGQHAIVDSTGKEYTCVAVTTADDVTTYTWVDDINANGGRFSFSGGKYCNIGANTIQQMSGLSVQYIGLGVNSYTGFLIQSGGTIRAYMEKSGEVYAQATYTQGITVIPAATTAYTLTEGCFSHAPAEASTYTFPAVTDTTRTHQIRLTLDFTTVQTYAFVDSQGTAITPLFTPTVSAGDVYEFDCEYSAVKAQWLIWPHKQGAVSDDYVMQSEVGAANGVAPLDSSSLVPVANLPKMTAYNTWGITRVMPNGGVDYSNTAGMEGLKTNPATKGVIDNRNPNAQSALNYYGPLTAYNLNYAVTAALTDAKHITLTSTQQQTAQSVIGASGVLHGSGAPTTSTVGKLLDRYEDDDTQKTYTCTAVTVDETDPQNPVTTYTWTDDVNAKGGTITDNELVIGRKSNNAALTIRADHGSVEGGYSTHANGDIAIALGNAVTVGSHRTVAFGYSITTVYGGTYNLIIGDHHSLTGANSSIFVAGSYSCEHPNGRVIVGDGTVSNARNGLELSKDESNLYIAGGYEQGITTIPAATTAYALAEGQSSHTPSNASTYSLPAIQQRIIANSQYFTRNPTTDGTGYYGWLSGSTNRYTASPTPSVGDNTYTNTALTQGAKPVTAIDNRTHECILDVLFTGYVRSTTDDGTGYYAWKDTKDNLLYTATDAPTAGTTEAYTDTALSTSAGVIALYDSASSSIAMVGTYSFEDSAGNAITPLSTPDIKPGSVITFLCRWSALLDQWTIMPVPQGVKLPVEVTP